MVRSIYAYSRANYSRDRRLEDMLGRVSELSRVRFPLYIYFPSARRESRVPKIKITYTFSA